MGVYNFTVVYETYHIAPVDGSVSHDDYCVRYVHGQIGDQLLEVLNSAIVGVNQLLPLDDSARGVAQKRWHNVGVVFAWFGDL